MGTPESLKNEVCPNCGNFVDRLVEFTGWCFRCSLPTILSINEAGEVTKVNSCIACGKAVGDNTHRKCRDCRYKDWLLEHGDEIDRCLANGISFYRARRLVSEHANDGLTCKSCGGPLKKPPRGIAYFCMKSQCRTAQNKLSRLMYEKGIKRETALEIVLGEIAHASSEDSTSTTMS